METISRFLWFAAILMIETLALTSQRIPGLDSIWDKAKHGGAFLTLTVLMYLAFPRLHLYKVQIWVLFLYGLQIEVIQYLLPHRDFSLLDLAANGGGIFLGILLICAGVYLSNLKSTK